MGLEYGAHNIGMFAIHTCTSMPSLLSYQGLIDKEMSVGEVANATGADAELVASMEKLLLKAEYKRRQAPPGVKIGTRNFGRDRRYPITNFFHTGPQVKLPR